MRKLLMITTALVCFGSDPARAEPITATIAFLTTGAGFGSVTSIFGMAAGTWGFTAATVGLRLAGSMLLNAAAQKLMSKSGGGYNQQAQRAELAKPANLPAYRFVYGNCAAMGTPVAWTTKGKILTICYLLNSRPSALSTAAVMFDKRPVSVSGDAFDFAGSGAAATNAPFSGHARYWIGRGDQTSCPTEIITASGGHFSVTDAWEGCTVLWAIFDCGNQDKRSERWPATPPALEVTGDWSVIHDPRTGITGPSRNQGLIVLDALRENPLRKYPDAHVWLETFEYAADVAEQAVPVVGGGTIPRYCCDGTLVWSEGAELEDQIGPLLAAGASKLIRVGGQLGIVPAVSRASVHTITEFTTGQPINLVRWQPAEDIYTEAVATYTAPDRAYESAEAPAYIVAGAQAADGGLAKRLDVRLDFVIDHRQAQRIAKIEVMRSRMQRAITAEAFPTAFELVAGSIATLNLPWPYGTWNGLYEVDQISPMAGINDDQSITVRLPMSLRETSASVYDWHPATEEQFVEPADYTPNTGVILPPSTLVAITGGDAALINGSQVTPRIQLEWTPSISASVTGYEWQYKIGAGDWIDGGFTTLTSVRRGWISPAQVGQSYRFRVRSMGIYGASDWLDAGPTVAAGLTEVLVAPEILMASGGAERIDLTIRQGGHVRADQIEIWTYTADSVGSAWLMATVPAGPNVTIAQSRTGLGSAETHYFWARARNAAFGSASPFSAGASATTT